MMSEEGIIPASVTNAAEILNMYEEICRLRAEVKHYKEMYEMLRDAQRKQLENTQKLLVNIFTKLCELVTIDPQNNIEVDL